MILDHYIEARNFLVSLAPFVRVLFAILGAAFLGIAARGWTRRARALTWVAALLASASFLVIGWFHARIATTINLAPWLAEGQAYRLYAPLWIESEKIFFWFLLFILASLVFLRRVGDDGFLRVWSGLAGLFSLLVAILDPFSNPLPQLHAELLAYEQALASHNGYAVNQLLGKFLFYYNTPYMWTHPPLLFASYALLVAALPAFLLGIRAPMTRLVELESLALGPMKLAYLFLTVGMLVGYPWALEAWRGSAWWWSPKINVSIMMWLLYSTYFHSRLYLGRKGFGRLTMLIGLIAFAALVFTYVTTYLIPEVHSYA